jgi:hypothetical protein
MFLLFPATFSKIRHPNCEVHVLAKAGRENRSRLSITALNEPSPGLQRSRAHRFKGASGPANRHWSRYRKQGAFSSARGLAPEWGWSNIRVRFRRHMNPTGAPTCSLRGPMAKQSLVRPSSFSDCVRVRSGIQVPLYKVSQFNTSDLKRSLPAFIHSTEHAR